MSNPLRLLSKLRRYGNQADGADYLKRENRQNIKAIEDAFRKIGSSVSDLSSSLSDLTSSVGNSTYTSYNGAVSDQVSVNAYTLMDKTVSLSSNGRGILVTLTGRDPSSIFTNFAVVATSAAQFYLERTNPDASTTMIAMHNNPSAAFRIESPIVWLDPNPPEGIVEYKLYAKVSGGGTLTFSSARMIAYRL